MVIRLEHMEFIWLQKVCKRSVAFPVQETVENYKVLEVLESAGLVKGNEFYIFEPTALGIKTFQNHSPWREEPAYISNVANHQARQILNGDRQELFCFGSPLNK